MPLVPSISVVQPPPPCLAQAAQGSPVRPLESHADADRFMCCPFDRCGSAQVARGAIVQARLSTSPTRAGLSAAAGRGVAQTVTDEVERQQPERRSPARATPPSTAPGRHSSSRVEQLLPQLGIGRLLTEAEDDRLARRSPPRRSPAWPARSAARSRWASTWRTAMRQRGCRARVAA